MALSPMQDYFPERKLFHGFVPLVMGTKLDALLVGPERSVSATLWERAVSEAQRLNAMLNRFDPLSEVSRLNAAADSGEVAVSEDLLSLIQVCETYRERTGGLFDIARGSCGEGILILPGSRVALQGGSLDFGGFAKGWFLRVFRSWLLEAGVGSAYVDFGGSTILALGTHPFGASWRVRVVHPYTGSVLEDVDLVDRTLSTSGNRPGYTGHVQDPSTGRPVKERRIVTVVSEDPLEAEVLSTAAMVPDDGGLTSLRQRFPSSEIHRFDA